MICTCECHTIGQKFVRTSYPAQACCNCDLEKEAQNLRDFRIMQADIETLKKERDKGVERIKKLENLSDIKKIEDLILNGLNTHLSILKCENRLNKLENQGMDILQDFEKRIDQLEKRKSIVTLI